MKNFICTAPRALIMTNGTFSQEISLVGFEIVSKGIKCRTFITTALFGQATASPFQFINAVKVLVPNTLNVCAYVNKDVIHAFVQI